ncbi:PucR family transcriptional regulator [Nocardia sp. SYP-A9097]|uniref:PucR family transcriptional regulator n=1 Tax=Nocardia sp. SYP-A9097 TaxID=2663237 RepID=UPI00129BAFCD|nr:helix-turn-helix domain-containing protein [Nocardia sp. SYP-A9097]MRH93432.1 PucR family transcriptional regulator [Nocardia sp. SYP-A9097]
MTTPSRTAAVTPGQLAAELLNSVEKLADQLVARVLDAERSYDGSQMLTHDELRDSCLDNLTSALRVLAGIAPIQLDSARAAGRLKAERGVPITAVLHAYRLCGRLMWEQLTKRSDGVADHEMLELSAQLWEIVDLYSDASADAYRETETLLTQADTESRTRLFQTLFDDHTENPARILDALRALGLPEQGSFAVLSADVGAVRPAESSNAKARLTQLGVTSIWDTQSDARVGLLCAPSATAIDHALPALGRAIGTRIGVSRTITRPDMIAAALGEARLSRICEPEGTTAVIRYDTLPLAQLLVRMPNATRSAAAQILGPLLRLPEGEQQELLTTLETWFACKGSNAAVAEQLHYHRNTILYRLHKVRDLTGRDVNDPAQAAELYIALQATRLLT